MEFDLKKYDIVVAPKCWNSYLIEKKMSIFPHNFKIFSKEEVQEFYFGKVQNSAYIEIMKIMNISYENAKMYADNFCYFEKSNNPKFLIVEKLYQELLDKGLIIKDEYSSLLFKNKKVLILGYGEKDVVLENILSKWCAEFEYAKYETNDNFLKIYQFSTIKDELFYLFNYLLKLQSDGEDLSKIRILYLGQEYVEEINAMATFFKMENLVDNKMPLFSYPSIVEIYNNLESTDVENMDSEDDVIKKAIELYKDYHLDSIDFPLRKEVFKSILNDNTYSKKTNYSLDFGNTLEYTRKKIIVLGFNQGNAPSVKKDVDYFDDDLKNKLGLMSSYQENENSRLLILDYITNQEVLYISYKLSCQGESYYPSSLIKDLKLKVLKGKFQYIYDNDYAKLLLGKYEDDKRKYGTISSYYHALSNHYSFDYMKYSNVVKNLDICLESVYQNYSYSKIKVYSLCKYAYYLQYILGLLEFEDNFSTKFGKIAHKVIEKAYDSDFDFSRAFLNASSEYEFKNDEQILLERLKEELESVVNIIRRHFNNMKVKNFEIEKSVKIQISENTYLNGVIDKIITLQVNNKDYYVIIDNKTGGEEFKEELLPYGIGLQLPIYELLLKDDEDYKHKELLGMFIQPLHINKIAIPKEDKEMFYLKNFKLQGVISNDIDGMSSFDPTYNDSSFIKGLKTLKNGEFRSSSKVVSIEELSKYADIALSKIKEIDSGIRKNDFEINPKLLNGKNISCTFCPFGDICCHTVKDEVELDVEEGENNVD